MINIHTIKPLDTEAVLNQSGKRNARLPWKNIISSADLGDAIAQAAAVHFPIPIEYVGTKDTFGESGTPTELLIKYGLDTPDVVKAVEKVMKRKAKA